MSKKVFAQVGAGRYALTCEREDVSAGGIILPDSARQKPSVGTIEFVGEGEERADGTLKTPRYSIGQQVSFGKWAGQDLLEDFGVFVIHEADVIGVVVDAEADD